MKAIIIAAGQGNRLTPMTNDRPKCLLEVGGKTILQWQLELLNMCGVKNIVLVRGYKREMLNFPSIEYYDNLDYENNNILKSLFYAKDEMSKEFIFSYSDILYEKAVLEKLLNIDDTALAAQTNVEYIKDFGRATDLAIDKVDSSDAQALFFMNPTRPQEVQDVADADEKMPQKSTFFFPKMFSGLVINILNMQ